MKPPVAAAPRSNRLQPGSRARRRDQRADQRRRGHVPEPDLLEVVRRVHQAPPERRDQLPVDRIRRRHPAAAAQTVFFGASDAPMTDEQLKSAPGPVLHLPTVLGAVVPVYNLPGVSRAEVHGPGAGRHLPRQDQEVERSGDREGQSRREAAGDRHRRRASVRRLGHDLHLRGLPVEGLAGVQEQGRRRTRR